VRLRSNKKACSHQIRPSKKSIEFHNLRRTQKSKYLRRIQPKALQRNNSLKVPKLLWTCLSVCLPVCFFVCLSACASVFLSVCLSVCLPTCLLAYLPACLLVFLSVSVWVPLYLSACLFFCLAYCLCRSVHVPVCLSVCVCRGAPVPVCLSVCLSGYLSLCLSAYVPSTCLSTSRVCWNTVYWPVCCSFALTAFMIVFLSS